MTEEISTVPDILFNKMHPVRVYSGKMQYGFTRMFFQITFGKIQLQKEAHVMHMTKEISSALIQTFQTRTGTLSRHAYESRLKSFE